MILQPEILTHPNIPKPLHGVNPRSIMGQAWWDRERKQVYLDQNNRCAACGVHKSRAEWHKWLEAHEFYTFDWSRGQVTFSHLVGLCHSCHQFIHSGRLLALVNVGELNRHRAVMILQHGFDVLANAQRKQDTAELGYDPVVIKSFKPYAMAIYAYHTLMGDSASSAGAEAHDRGWIPKVSDKIEWADWTLVFDGRVYPAKHKSYEDWYRHYHNGQDPPESEDFEEEAWPTYASR